MTPTQTSSHAPTDAGHGHDDGQVHAHAMPLWMLGGVFAILMILTGATVAATWVDLGEINIVIALAIAVVKASLVCLYFMHLRYDSPFNAVVLVVALVFVALFVAIPLMDSLGYASNLAASDAVEAAAAAPPPAAPVAPAK